MITLPHLAPPATSMACLCRRPPLPAPARLEQTKYIYIYIYFYIELLTPPLLSFSGEKGGPSGGPTASEPRE